MKLPTKTTNTLDLVTLVTPTDEVIGQMDKVAAHRGNGKLHRAISVFLFRKNLETNRVELLVQKRSAEKIVGAGEWANTVCGNVWPGESYAACAWRRLKMELGIEKNEQLVLQPAQKFQYQVQCNAEFSENEMDQVFVGWFDGVVRPNSTEVSEYAWIDWELVKQGNTDNDWAPWFEIMMKNTNIQESLNRFLC